MTTGEAKGERTEVDLGLARVGLVAGGQGKDGVLRRERDRVEDVVIGALLLLLVLVGGVGRHGWVEG